MSEERRRILDMLARGKISADEAEQLLDAMSAPNTNSKPVSERNVSLSSASRQAKYLRVLVENEEDAQRVNIRVPLQLLRAGIKLAALIPQKAQEQVDQALKSKGVQFTLSELTPEMMDELLAAMSELSLDVNDKKQQVRIYCE